MWDPQGKCRQTNQLGPLSLMEGIAQDKAVSPLKEGSKKLGVSPRALPLMEEFQSWISPTPRDWG